MSGSEGETLASRDISTAPEAVRAVYAQLNNISSVGIANLINQVSVGPAWYLTQLQSQWANEMNAFVDQVSRSQVLRVTTMLNKLVVLRSKGIDDLIMQVSSAPAAVLCAHLDQLLVQNVKEIASFVDQVVASSELRYLAELRTQHTKVINTLVNQVSGSPARQLTAMLDQLSPEQSKLISELVVEVTATQSRVSDELLMQLAENPSLVVEVADEVAASSGLEDLSAAFNTLIHELIRFGGVVTLLWLLIIVRAVYSDGDGGDRGQTFDGVLAIAVACAASTGAFKKAADKIAPKK